MFETKMLPANPTTTAPDGSEVRVLLGVGGGGMAHFELPSGETTVAVRHGTVEEIWYFISGRGQVWRRHEDAEAIVDVHPGLCISIPVETDFQFRAFGHEPLAAVGVTMPPWPSDEEALLIDGPWDATVDAGPH